MTFITKSAGLAAILAASVSGAALAQSANLGADAGASVGADDGGVSADVGADVTADSGSMGDSGNATSTATGDADTDMAASGTSDDMNYGRVISSIRAGQNAQADIAGITADSQVETIALSELQGEAGENASALDNALADAEGEMASMQDMIAANADFQAMLEAEGYAADDVIGVYSKADGGFEVLIDDRS